MYHKMYRISRHIIKAEALSPISQAWRAVIPLNSLIFAILC